MAVTITITSPTGSEFNLAQWFASADLANPMSATAGEYFLESNGSFLNGRVQLHFKSSTNDLTYDGNNIPIGGTFDSLEIFSEAQNQVVATITGLNYGAAQFYFDVSNGNSDLAQSTILNDAITYTGDDGQDNFTSGTGFDNLSGGKGDDYLDVGSGGGMVSGGEGNDYLKAVTTTTLDGGDGNDILEGGIVDQTYNGGDGFDTITFANAHIGIGKGIEVTGDGHVFDTEYYYESYTSIEKIIGSAFDDRITDGADNMMFDGGGGKDFIFGGQGDDWINGGSGVDTLDGGEGTDTLSFEGAAAAVNVTLGAGGAEKTGSGGEAAGDKFKNFENIIGGNGADTLTGNELNNILLGGVGKDKIFGVAGNDRILGAEDNDTLDGGLGDDLIDGGSGADSITGNTGFDTVTYVNSAAAVTVNYATNVNKGGDAGADKLFSVERIIGSKNADSLTGNGTLIIEGGEGADTITGKLNDYASYQASQAAVTVDLTVTAQTSTGDANGDQLVGILNLLGSDFADKLTGNDKDNIFQGLNGADIIDGGAGIDTLNYASSKAGINIILGATGDGMGSGGDAEGDQYIRIENIIGTDFADAFIGNQLVNKIIAGKGDDEIDGGAGADIIDGGEGIDTIYYDTSDAGVTINLATNIHTGGTAQGDKLSLIENIIGSDFKDKLTGSTLANSINGGAGEDSIDGGAGNDILNGGAGKDTIFGNSGDDVIAGGADADSLDGGANIDTLNYAGSNAVRVKLSEGAVAQVQSGALIVNGENINLGGADAADDSVKNFENLAGTGFDDVLVGNAGLNSIFGGLGKDNIEGGKGNDVIEGGAGADVLNGGTGMGIDANAGIDTLSYASDTTGVSINLMSKSANFGHADGDVFSNFRNVLGGSNGDTLIGDAAVNTLIGAAGIDLLTGGGGKDILDGGSDFDTVDYKMLADGITLTLGVNGAQTFVTGKAGTDAVGDAIKNIEGIYGTTGNDVLTGNALANSLSGNDGDDLIQGGAGTDFLDGGFNGTDTSLKDTLSYAASLAGVTVTLNTAITIGEGGDAHGDNIIGFENIIGSSKNDTLISYLPNLANTIKGGAGDDIIDGGEEGDLLFGESGIDTLSYANDSFGVTVVLKAGLAADVSGSVAMFNHAKGDVATGFENLIGGIGKDALTGDSGANVIQGGGGEDILDGGAGNNDTVSYADFSTGITLTLGFNGAETFNSLDNDSVKDFENITGGGGVDKLTGNNLANILFGGGGADTLIGGAGADTLNGGGGFDTVDYSDLTATQGITVTLGKGGAISTVTSSGGSPAHNDKLIDIEIVKGGAGNDKFTGNEFYNEFHGNDGNDLFIGAIGGHFFSGGNGSDTVNYASSTAGVSISLMTNSANGGYADSDSINSIENAIGSAFNDVISGSDADNTISAGAGNDIVAGTGVGVDVFDGGSDSALNPVFFFTYGDLLDYSSLTDLDIVLTLGANGVQTVVAASGMNAAIANGDKVVNFESIWSGSGNDILKGNNLANSIRGEGGDDLIDGGPGNDFLSGGAGGIDTLSYASATAGVTVNLNQGTAQNTVGAGTDTIADFENLIGSAKADKLAGGGGANKIEGGAGDDIIIGAGGADILIGGDGIDTVSYENGGNVTVDLNVQDGVAAQAGTGGDETGDILSGFENLTGSEAINKLSGNAGANIIKGLAGSDTIQGRGGADTLDGGADLDIVSYIADTTGVTVTLGVNGAQTIGKGGDAEGDKILNFEWIRGGSGKDTLTGNNLANEIYGGDGDDILDGGAGAVDDYLNGEGGFFNTASYLSSTAGVTVNMNMVGGAQNTVGAGIDTLVNIRNLIGSNKNDVLTASNVTVGVVDGAGGDDTINGSDVENTLLGGAGNDSLFGGLGQDILDGGAGNDVIDGGAHGDTVSYASATSGVTVSLLLQGAAQNTVGAGKDTLSNIEHITGSKFNDTLTGNASLNFIDGGEGNDTIIVAGGIFADTYTGGLGNDSFRFNDSSIGISIVDFGTGLDKIGISKVGFGIANSVSLNGVGVNNFAAEYFVSGAGAVADKVHSQFVFNTTTSMLYWDADGTGADAADAIVLFNNSHNLLATEFTLI